MDEVEHLALSVGQVGDEPDEVVGVLDARVLSPAAGSQSAGSVSSAFAPHVEAAHRPLDYFPDDHAEGHALLLAPLELVEQAEEDDLRGLVGSLAVSQAQEAELAHGVEVPGEQKLVVAGLEQSLVFDVTRIVHREQSLSGYGSIYGGLLGLRPLLVNEPQGLLRPQLRDLGLAHVSLVLQHAHEIGRKRRLLFRRLARPLDRLPAF